jgi:hypothetical protein
VNTHPPVAGSHLSVVQKLLSLQATVGMKTHPVAGSQLSVVHALLSLQTRAPPTWQVPFASHESGSVHAFPSLHGVPAGGVPAMHVPCLQTLLQLEPQSAWSVEFGMQRPSSSQERQVPQSVPTEAGAVTWQVAGELAGLQVPSERHRSVVTSTWTVHESGTSSAEQLMVPHAASSEGIVHTPTEPGSAQAAQAACLQALSQQTPSAQKAVEHCPPLTHAVPAASFGTQALPWQ